MVNKVIVTLFYVPFLWQSKWLMGPWEVIYLVMVPWRATHREWTPLLIKAVDPSVGKNKCPMGHNSYGHGPMGGYLPTPHPPLAKPQHPVWVKIADTSFFTISVSAFGSNLSIGFW